VDSRPPLAHAVLQPVGPLPPRVYWTRRLVVLAVIAVLIAAVAVACSGGSTHPRHRATPIVSPSPVPSPAAANGKCTGAGINVVATTDADKYAPGTLPRLTVTVSTKGAVSCVLTESPSARTWTIVSGPDQIWTTAGCQSGHNASRTVLKPGAPVRHTIVWNRHRSDKKCAVSAVATPGTYQLIVVVNGVQSQPAVFHLTA
jgi:hypothetical protein